MKSCLADLTRRLNHPQPALLTRIDRSQPALLTRRLNQPQPALLTRIDRRHPFGFPSLPGRLEVNIVLGMKLWGIVMNEKAKLHWLLADDGAEVRVDVPKCICFLTPALVAGGYDPLGLHGTEVRVRAPK